MTARKWGICMDNSEIKSDMLTDKGGDICFTGHNLKDPKQLILQELEEYYDEFEIIAFEILKTEEIAYSSSKFCDGQSAEDEGYSHFIEYKPKWKQGYGKCTKYTIAYKLKEVNYHS